MTYSRKQETARKRATVARQRARRQAQVGDLGAVNKGVMTSVQKSNLNIDVAPVNKVNIDLTDKQVEREIVAKPLSKVEKQIIARRRVAKRRAMAARKRTIAAKKVVAAKQPARVAKPAVTEETLKARKAAIRRAKMAKIRREAQEAQKNISTVNKSDFVDPQETELDIEIAPVNAVNIEAPKPSTIAPQNGGNQGGVTPPESVVAPEGKQAKFNNAYRLATLRKASGLAPKSASCRAIANNIMRKMSNKEIVSETISLRKSASKKAPVAKRATAPVRTNKRASLRNARPVHNHTSDSAEDLFL